MKENLELNLCLVVAHEQKPTMCTEGYTRQGRGCLAEGRDFLWRSPVTEDEDLGWILQLCPLLVVFWGNLYQIFWLVNFLAMLGVFKSSPIPSHLLQN